MSDRANGGLPSSLAEPNWRLKAEEHRMMARAAIRIALRHGIRSADIEAEYEKVRAEEIANAR